MKCQSCNNPATYHVTEMANGNPIELHVCEEHLPDLEKLKEVGSLPVPFAQCSNDFNKAFGNSIAREKLAAYLLPALCLGLADDNADVRILAAFWLDSYSLDTKSALGALRDRLLDPDQRVRKVVAWVIDQIEAREKKKE